MTPLKKKTKIKKTKIHKKIDIMEKTKNTSATVSIIIIIIVIFGITQCQRLSERSRNRELRKKYPSEEKTIYEESQEADAEYEENSNQSQWFNSI